MSFLVQLVQAVLGLIGLGDVSGVPELVEFVVGLFSAWFGF